MKYQISFIFFILFNSIICFSQNFKLFLIGDTGEDTVLQPTMKNFLDTISLYPNSAVVFLGDNCYKKWIFGGEKKGFDSSEITIKRLGSQLKGIENSKYKGSVYFIPGNHDWWNVTCMKKGLRALQMEESFIETNMSENQSIRNNKNPFMPRNGNPITAIDLNNGQLKLIFIDTQWLIIQKNKAERNKVYHSLDSILNNAIFNNQKIVVVGHHPIYTIGSHSKKHWNQFPKVWKDQDIYHPLYNSMRNSIDSILLQKSYPIIYSCGHDHGLQYFQKGSVQYIVSGGGSKTTRFNKKNEFNPSPGEDIPVPQFRKHKEGYFAVDCSGENVSVNVYFMDEKLIKEVIK
jgi:hypothetical protein